MKTSKKEQISIIAVVVICAFCYISLVFNTNVWMDEAFTATLAHHSFKEVIYLSMMDTLPPLYNIILWLMTSIFGYTVPVMKITSIIPMILTMVLGATTVRKRFGLPVAVAFILSITCMPLMLYYGVEIRMYSLGFFFATAAGIYAHEVLCDSNKKNWILFTLFSVLAGYSHHFAFVTVGFVYLYILLHYIFADRKHIVRWFKCLGATFIAYLPCMVVTLRQLANVSGYFSMPDVTLHLFIQYVLYPYMVGVFFASILCVLLMFACIVLFAYSFFILKERDGDNIYSICCFVTYYGVLIFGTIVSKIMTANIFVDRYLFFSTGLLWMFAAIQIGRLYKKIKPAYIVAIAVILLIGICSYKVEHKIEYGNSADEEIEFLAENVHEGDIFLGLGGHEEMENCIPFLSLLNKDGASLTCVYTLESGLDKLKGSDDNEMTLWISFFDDYALSSEDTALLESYGYQLEKASDFEFDRYECELYKTVPLR